VVGEDVTLVDKAAATTAEAVAQLRPSAGWRVAKQARSRIFSWQPTPRNPLRARRRDFLGSTIDPGTVETDRSSK